MRAVTLQPLAEGFRSALQEIITLAGHVRRRRHSGGECCDEF
jgi:hypothetical protein